MNKIKNNREFMKSPSFGKTMKESDQQNGIEPPRYEREITGKFIELPTFDDHVVYHSYLELLDQRRSVRIYEKDIAITKQQLAFLLWSAGGIQEYRGKNNMTTFRPVPSAGARHPFELYITVKNVEGLESGLYRYAPTKNAKEKKVTIEYLAPLFTDYETRINEALGGQKWAVQAPIIIFVSCLPYRSEWRYSEASHRVMLIDLGHVGQNFMLSATALGLGSCCIASFNQELCDEIFSFDGNDEYTVYVLPVGNPKIKN